MSFVADRDAAGQNPYQCLCQPEGHQGVVGEISVSGNTVGCKVPYMQLASAPRIDCSLLSGGQKLFQASTDLSSLNAMRRLETEVADTRQQLAQCQQLGVKAEKPQNLQGRAVSPKTAEIQFDGAPCAGSRIQLRADDGETKNAIGRWNGIRHVATVHDLTPGKSYKVTVRLVNPETTVELPNTQAAMAGEIVQPHVTSEITSTSTPKFVQTPSGVHLSGTANHPGEFWVELADFDKATGFLNSATAQRQKVVAGDGNTWSTAFNLPRTTTAKSLKYRLVRTDGTFMEDWLSTTPITLLPSLTFTAPLKITITPVGPIVSWKSSVVPKTAELVVRTSDSPDVTHQRSTTASPKSPDIALALGPDDAKWLLSQAKSTVRPVVIARMTGTEVDPQETVSREIQLEIIESKEAVAATLQTVSLSDDEKAKLTKAGQKVIKSWAEKVNWGSVLTWLLKGVAAGL
ncbi:MAG: fibronectin type III domain-containing protein [Thermoanaerobaculia bacterium]